MICGFIKGQELTLTTPVIADGTIDYLTAIFTFQTKDWHGLKIYAHFWQGETHFFAEVINGRIEKDKHINLSKGEWQVSLHGNEVVDGKVLMRVTTEPKKIIVVESGTKGGDVFPEMAGDAGEQILAKADYAVKIANEAKQGMEQLPIVTVLPQIAKRGDACRYLRSEITEFDGGRIVVFNYANLKNLVEIGETHYNKVNYTINVNADEYSAWLRISVSYSHDEVKITVDKYNSLYDSYEGDYEQWENIFFLNNDSEWEFSTADNNAAFTPSYYYNAKTNTTTHLLEPLASVNIPDEYISSVTVEKDIDINIFDINIFHLEPIIMLYDGKWRAVANESLLYQQKGATISKHDIVKKNDGSKFFRLYLDWGNKTPLLTAKRWIDIPIEGAKEVTKEGSDPGIGTQSTGLQLQLGGGGSTKTIPIVSTLPEIAKDGDVVLYKPEVNKISVGDGGRTVVFNWDWVNNLNLNDGDEIYIYSDKAEDAPQIFDYTIIKDGANLFIDIKSSTDERAESGIVYNYRVAFVRTDSGWVFNPLNSVLEKTVWTDFDTSEVETVSLAEPIAEIEILDEINSVVYSNNYEQFAKSNMFFYILPEFLKHQSGTWNKLIAVPTKTSELENDSGFITAKDIPQENLSQFIEEMASSVNLYPPTTEGWSNSATLSNGTITSNTKNNSYVTPQISVEPNTIYTITDVFYWNEISTLADRNKGRAYAENGAVLNEMVFAPNADGSYTFTTPENASYMYLMGYKQGLSTPTATIETIIELFNSKFMLVKGTELPSVFEPYGKGSYRLKNVEIPLKSVKLENVNDKALPIFAPLAGKKIANFGDSIFGNARPPEDVSTYLAEKTGAEVLNCAFGGCRMAINSQVGHWNAFSMVNLATAIASGDYSVQDEALEYDDRTSYAEQPLSVVKSTDFSTVDILTIAYGSNDFNNNIPLDNEENPYDTATFAGALRTSIESLLTAYPNLRIFILSIAYRYWIDNNNEFVDDTNTHTNGGGKLTADYNAKLKEVASEYNLHYVDDYNIGIGKFNRTHYFGTTDPAHHIESGRQLIAEHLATALCGGNNYCSADGVYERVEAPAIAKIVPNKEYVFGEVTELTVSFAEGSVGRRNEYLFNFISGEKATVLTLPSSVKWVNELTVEANKRYEISVVDDVALWCAVDYTAEVTE